MCRVKSRVEEGAGKLEGKIFLKIRLTSARVAKAVSSFDKCYLIYSDQSSRLAFTRHPWPVADTDDLKDGRDE